MKPTIGNIRKAAAETDDPEALSILMDHVEFYISGLKTATEGLGRSINSIEPLLDNARRTREFIEDKIRTMRIIHGS